jgi:hypothetical protein
MTMPDERTRAVVRAREFLRRLSSPGGGGIKGVPKAVREEAWRVLRHFPDLMDLGREESFDNKVVEEYYDEQERQWARDWGPVGPQGDEGEPGKSADS